MQNPLPASLISFFNSLSKMGCVFPKQQLKTLSSFPFVTSGEGMSPCSRDGYHYLHLSAAMVVLSCVLQVGFCPWCVHVHLLNLSSEW